MSTQLASAFLASGCRRSGESASAVASVDADAAATAAPPVEFVDDSFESLAHRFLEGWRVPVGQRAAGWERYRGKWVRWTGKLVSFTKNGATFKMDSSTWTFDVVLAVETPGLLRLHRFHPGDRVTFVGRFQVAEDLSRTFYLDHGDVAPPVAPAPAAAAPLLPDLERDRAGLRHRRR
jgi:hypothetical protein